MTAGAPRSPRLAAPGQLPAPAPRADLVVLAASTGGLAALAAVLAGLPGDFPAAVAVVLHRTERPVDLLVPILARRTALRVETAAPGAAVRPATVHVAPAGGHLRVEADGTFSVHAAVRFRNVTSAADPLLVSAAERFGAGVIAVILTGTGRDGAAGAAVVRHAGGLVIAQDPATSRARGMPEAAIATRAVHATVPLGEIAARVVALVGGR